MEGIATAPTRWHRGFLSPLRFSSPGGVRSRRNLPTATNSFTVNSPLQTGQNCRCHSTPARSMFGLFPRKYRPRTSGARCDMQKIKAGTRFTIADCGCVFCTLRDKQASLSACAVFWQAVKSQGKLAALPRYCDGVTIFRRHRDHRPQSRKQYCSRTLDVLPRYSRWSGTWHLRGTIRRWTSGVNKVQSF